MLLCSNSVRISDKRFFFSVLPHRVQRLSAPHPSNSVSNRFEDEWLRMSESWFDTRPNAGKMFTFVGGELERSLDCQVGAGFRDFSRRL